MKLEEIDYWMMVYFGIILLGIWMARNSKL